MPEELLYVGCKLIKAYEMSANAFRKATGKPTLAEDEPGYHVEYPDGYESWSPKDVFERAYREVTDTEKDFITT